VGGDYYKRDDQQRKCQQLEYHIYNIKDQLCNTISIILRTNYVIPSCYKVVLVEHGTKKEQEQTFYAEVQ